MPSEIFGALKIGLVEQIELEELVISFFDHRTGFERRAIYEKQGGAARIGSTIHQAWRDQ